jgi:hypothetical protein
MASKPKRRRKTPARYVERPVLEPPAAEDTITAGETASSSDIDTVVNRCMDKLIPTLEDSFRSFMDKFHHGHVEENTTPVPPPATLPTETEGPPKVPSIPLLEDITSGTALLDPIPSTPHNSSFFTSAVEDKTRAKIHAGEYVKFSTLLPTRPGSEDNTTKYSSVDKDGQLVFVSSNDKHEIKSLLQWIKAFHIFVAIYSEKHPTETGNLMAYGHKIQCIAEACGNTAAFAYDDNFRRWRQRNPSVCPWGVNKLALCVPF